MTRQHVDLEAAARQSMIEHGFQPDFSDATQAEAARLTAAPLVADSAEDLRGLLWSSIDNDTSRDLDQLEVAEEVSGGAIRVRIAIADVDAVASRGSAIDQHAERETTSVYTGVRTFPMLPDALSAGTTSLLEGQDRLAMVTEYLVEPDGRSSDGRIYPALVRNRAQLAYNGVGPWLEGTGDAPQKVAESNDLAAQLKLQDRAAQLLRRQRFCCGALNIETVETHPVMLRDQIIDIAQQSKNRATQLIEDFMIAANGSVARYLRGAKVDSLRRVVRTPKRWDRIVELAEQWHHRLPSEPDPKALNDFLTAVEGEDRDHFPDVSLAVVKLLGPGEYVVEREGELPEGHFGLAVQDYTHSTAPNRRFADLATQRALKASLAGKPPAYSGDELAGIARNCTLREDGARKVEREMRKRIAAMVMSERIGQHFRAIVAGVNQHGTFVRVLSPHLEGMLVRGAKGLDVGDRLEVTLVNTDVSRGYIDFARS